MLNFSTMFSTKLRRFIYVVVLNFVALIISWINLSRIYPDDPHSFVESSAVSLITGFLSLHGSVSYLFANLFGKNTGSLFILIFSVFAFISMIVFILRGSKFAGWSITLYMLIAAPYWAYWGFAIMGI